MSIYRWIIGSLLAILLSFVVFFGVVIYLDQTESNDVEAEEDEETLEVEQNVGREEEIEDEVEGEGEAPDVELNPFGDSVSQSELTYAQVRDYIHKMSHQKVEASVKRGFYLITDERIEWLIQGIERSQDELGEDAGVYLDILTRFKEGDFSRADEDHNTIWRMQNGEIGKATGVLSEEEEQAYIEAHIEEDEAAYDDYRSMHLE
ncbi:DUF6241 domain-containing protein [Alkalibacillus silvisoli]|uniref:Uncharacterized protein n=1 Tax=Alkalibacillus silvisoli TaxID=392823 RepID=A0ABN1A328_9BACI